MKLAIVGSRSFSNYDFLVENLSQIVTKDDIIVSGGARGADTLASKYAYQYNLKLVVFKPDWEKFGKSAGYLRNVEIVNYCDKLLAFWDNKSKGTKHSIDIAIKQKKLLKVILV